MARELMAATKRQLGAILLESGRIDQTDVDRVLAGVTPSDLHTRRVIQSNDVSVLEAIYHVVEHFSMHTGQIVYITKQRSGADLGF